MYGILITLAIITTLLLAERQVRNRGLDTNIFWEGSFATILMGIVGARLYHVIDFYELYAKNPLAILAIWNGGLGIFGALIAGTLTLALYLKMKKQKTWQWLDVIALNLPLAQTIGRLGNYFNKEILPYALYEMVLNMGLYFILLYINTKSKRYGILFMCYVMGYAIIRIFLEPIKIDPWTIYGLNVAQSISILILVVSTGILTRWYLKTKG